MVPLYVLSLLVVKYRLISGYPKVTANELLPAGLGIDIRDGKIAALGYNLAAHSSCKVIDAEGAYITPGGIVSHAHVQQDNAPTGDTWETASRSAIAGVTTTILAFASNGKIGVGRASLSQIRCR